MRLFFKFKHYFGLQIRFPLLFNALLLAQGCLLGSSPPIHSPSNGDQSVNRRAYRLNPYQMCAETLQSLAVGAKFESVTRPLLEHRHWANAGDVTAFVDLVASMTSLYVSSPV